jgi:AAA+ superfamily predicted ATPase
VNALSPTAERCVTRVKLRARRNVLWLRSLWDSTPGSLGLSISYEEVDRLLTDERDLNAAQAAFRADDPPSAALAGPIAAADAAAVGDPMLDRLRDAFDLSDAEVDLLTLTVAAEADPWTRRVFAFIHDDATRPLPTLWLARQLFDWSSSTSPVGSDSNLVRWRLAHPGEGQASPWSVTASWEPDPFLMRWFHGTPLDPSLGPALRLVRSADAPAPSLCLYPAALGTMVSFLKALGGDASREVVIAGPPGAGRRTLAVQLCARLGLDLVVVDSSAVLGPGLDPDAVRAAVARVERTARLLDAAVYWDGAAPATDHRPVPPARLELVGTRDPVPGPVFEGVVRRTVRLPGLTQADRRALWAAVSPQPVPQPVLDWTLLPADIVGAAAAAPAGHEAVVDACRATISVDAGPLATALPQPFTWDDLVLPAPVMEHIRELDAQAHLRWPVYEEWGMGRLCSMGRGIAALFAGASGTGKTMAAQVLARSLETELYRIDLSAVVSKYIGETEKHLRELFDSCERANVLLFFDEADALFGRRTEVKDAHDRFANIEIDYLLQRMEQFDGITVLATNRKHEIDRAFMRRFRFVVDFLSPGVPERRELWRRALPTHSPDGDALLDGIDLDWLAERLTMTGADITNAALAAAFLARAEGARIRMDHIVHAASRELEKRGEVVRVGALDR